VSSNSGFIRGVFVAAGVVCVALGALGAVIPVLPTTPFLLLAAACFARGSARAHQWLLRNRFSGPVIRTWERDRGLTLKTKVFTVLLLILALAASAIWGVKSMGLRIMLAGVGAIGLFVVLRLRTVPAEVRG